MDRQIQWLIFITYGTYLLQTLNNLTTGSHTLFFLTYVIFIWNICWFLCMRQVSPTPCESWLTNLKRVSPVNWGLMPTAWPALVSNVRVFGVFFFLILLFLLNPLSAIHLAQQSEPGDSGLLSERGEKSCWPALVETLLYLNSSFLTKKSN